MMHPRPRILQYVLSPKQAAKVKARNLLDSYTEDSGEEPQSGADEEDEQAKAGINLGLAHSDTQ